MDKIVMRNFDLKFLEMAESIIVKVEKTQEDNKN
jgi:hypothetical protein